MIRRRTLSMAILAALAIGLQWWVFLQEQDLTDSGPLPEPRSDYTLTRFDLLVMNKDGEASFHITAPYLEKNPNDQSLAIMKPNVLLYNQHNTQWTIVSESGWISEDGEQLRLDGKVHMVSDSEDDPVTIDGTNFMVAPQSKQVDSDDAVVMTRPLGLYQGVGFSADIRNNILEILSEVTARYEPE